MAVVNLKNKIVLRIYGTPTPLKARRDRFGKSVTRRLQYIGNSYKEAAIVY